MTLSLTKAYAPMEAQPAEELPRGPDWHYEPKWDGFRCIAFVAGSHVDLQSKAGGSRSIPNWWWKFNSTISRAVVFVTEQGSCGGGPKRRQPTAR
jgi:hypothetical protein